MPKRRPSGPNYRTHPYEYRIWTTTRYACINPYSKGWKHYGAKGITICRAWDKSFARFLRDMGERPCETAKLVRKDEKLGFWPSNCEWRDYGVRNVGVRTKFFYVDGRWLPLQEAARVSEVSWTTVHSRIRKGLPPDKVLAKPGSIGGGGRGPTIMVEHNGEKVPLREAARRSGRRYITVYERYRRGLRGDALFTPLLRRRRTGAKNAVSP